MLRSAVAKGARAMQRRFATEVPQSGERHGAPASETAGMGHDPEVGYGSNHPFYDPFYASTLFEYEFEEGFLDNSAFMMPEDRRLADQQ